MITGIPYDVEVEYLETNGAQYINTGLEMASGHEIRARHMFKRSSTRQLMGSNGARQYYGVTASGYIEFGIVGSYTSTVEVDESKEYLISFVAKDGNNTGKIYDGSTLLWSGTGAYSSFNNPFEIFRLPGFAQMMFVSGNRIYGFQHLVDGKLVQDLIPVRVGTVGYMYDRVSRKLFGNSGTGSFNVGPDVARPILGFHIYPTIEEFWGLTFTANEPNVVVNMQKQGSPLSVSLEYSRNNVDWHTFDGDDATTPVTLSNIGDKVYFRAGPNGNVGMSYSEDDTHYFTLSGSAGASGNIMSLLTQNENSAESTAMGYYCFAKLFMDCENLTSAPELPAVTISPVCYAYMFLGCTSLVSPPDLPATELEPYCYYSMFSGCASLAIAPELTATTLANFCYSGMFYGCSSLTTAPELTATTLANSCYSSMFNGCTSLTSAPELTATTLASYCYNNMFNGCTSLSSAPELPATTLATGCYTSMFYGCTSLTSAPELPATTLANSCYFYMFQGCTSLSSVSVSFTDWNTSASSTSNWLYNVAPNGTFTCMSALDTTTRDASHVPANWNVVEKKFWGLTFTAGEPNVTVNMTKNGSPDAVSLEYCPGSADYTDDGNWVTFDADNGTTPITLTSVGDKVYFRAGSSGNARISKSDSAYRTFTLSGSAGASGNIMSLLTQNESEWQSVQMGTYCFFRLFYNRTSLTAAPELPATTLATYCYRGMFQGCTSLTSAPELTATTLADCCYFQMFQGCTSLSSAPELPATTLAIGCYYNMFSGCTSLTSAPELPATTLASTCYYYMFRNCTSLASATELPAMTLADSCYNSMFYGCSSLSAAPELSATTLASSCYQYMFYGCTSLTTAPELPATTLADRCYQYMFQGCSSLSAAPELSATTLANYCYNNIFQGCTSLTSAPELPATTLATSCYSSMFSGCTALTSAPELPVTTLTTYCYSQMFRDCTSLTSAPELPATTLAVNCYQSMFNGCSSLSSVEVAFTDWNTSGNSTNSWLNGVASTGTFTCPEGLDTTTRDASHVPQNWNVDEF